MARIAWNIEVACIAATPGSDLEDAVPDVFGVTERTLGFEDADERPHGTGAGRRADPDWYVVLDVGCRLAASPDYAIEASAKGDAFIFRIADPATELYWRNGKPQKVRENIRDETAAWAQMKERTGHTYDDLFGNRIELIGASGVIAGRSCDERLLRAAPP